LEARVGIEPTHEAFAEPCLTTWLPRRIHGLKSIINGCERKCNSLQQSIGMRLVALMTKASENRRDLLSGGNDSQDTFWGHSHAERPVLFRERKICLSAVMFCPVGVF
jgi:hypothetical protein